MTIKRKVQTRVKRSKGSVFMRSDFKDIAGYDQVGRALRELVQEGLLIKISYGLYARARINRVTGNVMADNPSGYDGVVIEAMEKLGVEYQLDDLSNMYLSGESTQIPAKVKIIPKSTRFTRKIAIGTQTVNIARNN
jgi:hypothetical protein